MANMDKIRMVLKMLISAGLRGTPERSTLNDLVVIWAEALSDVPGKALDQGALDIIRSEDFWPTVNRLRKAAYQVQIHNYQSAVPNHWKDDTRTSREFPFAALVGSDGHYYSVIVDISQPRDRSIDFFPLDVQARLQEIEERTRGILKEEDCRLIDQLTAPYQERIDEWVRGSSEKR